LLANTRPLIVGWMNVINQEDYGAYDFTYKPTPANSNAALTPSPRFSLSKRHRPALQVGIDAISSESTPSPTTSSPACAPKATRSSAPDADSWSGIVSFISPIHNHAESAALSAKTTKPKSPPRRRSAAHRIYNTEIQIDRSSSICRVISGLFYASTSSSVRVNICFEARHPKHIIAAGFC